MKKVYQCENCSQVHTLKTFIFGCIFCGGEICDICMFEKATCKNCAAVKTTEDIDQVYEEKYG